MRNVSATIESLREFNQIQEEAIGNLEAYERTVSGWESGAVKSSGYRNKYAAELRYLRHRRLKLDIAIASIEKYERVATMVQQLA